MSEQKNQTVQNAKDTAPDIRDVIVKKKTSGIREKARAARGSAAALEEKKPYLVLCGVIATALTVILISVLALKLPVVAVCLIVLLEAGLAVCLNNEPVWLHGAVIVTEVVAGAIAGKLVFMLLCAVIYVAGILALKILRE